MFRCDSPLVLRLSCAVRHRLQKSRTEQRNHRHRHEIRGKQRDDDGQSQRGEEKFADAVQKGDREEDHHRRQRGRQNRQADFRCLPPRRRLRAQRPSPGDDKCFPARSRSYRSRARRPAPSPPRIMVLTVLPIMYKHHEGRQRGKGNGEENSRSRAKASQKDQNHQAGEKQADQAFVQQRLDGFFDEGRLVEHHAWPSSAWECRTDGRSCSRMPSTTCDGVGVAALLHDGHVHRLLPIHAHDVVLNLIGVLRPCPCRPP